MICASSLLVLSCSRRFHRWISEIVFLSTITIANFVSCWEMVLRAQFLANEFLVFLSQFVASSILVQSVAPRSMWFQLVLGGSSFFIVLLCAGSTTCWRYCCLQFLVSFFPNLNVSSALSKSNFHKINKPPFLGQCYIKKFLIIYTGRVYL